MIRNLPNIGLVLGVVLLVAGTISVRFAWPRLAGRPKRVLFALIGLGLGFGVLSVGDYYMSPTEHVIGFPFLSFMLIKKRGVWLDYLGLFSVPALLANAYVGFTLPFIVASVWLRSHQQRTSSTGPGES